MSQYQTGTVDVTSGSATVAGTGTLWVANATVGDLFMIRDVNVHYQVATISNDTQIVLNSAWAGSSLTDQTYQIVRDFTPNHDLPEIHPGDRNWAFNVTVAFRMINLLLTTISAFEYSVVDHTDETTVTLALSDMNKIHICSTATLKCVVTLPSVDATDIGDWVKIRKAGAGEVEINASDSDTILDTGTSVSNAYTTETFGHIELYLETGVHWACGGMLGRWATS